jgi:prepilin-type N-terminal cleavage/methylation domain-containing protein
VDNPTRNRGFTLIELLVVVAIIAVLISILLPVINLAREQAKTAACAHQLHQLGLGVMYYAKENNDIVPFCDGPGVEEWYRYSPYLAAFQKYAGLERRDIFFCPAAFLTKAQIDYSWEGTNSDKTYIGYNYLANRSQTNGCGWWFPAEKPIINIDQDYDGWAPATRLLFTDKISTDSLGQINNPPRGSNHMYGDGHLRWWGFASLRIHPLWNITYAPIHHQLWD